MTLVNSICCSYKGPGFGTHHPCGGSQLSCNFSSWCLIPSSDLHGYLHALRHMYIHIQSSTVLEKMQRKLKGKRK